MDVAELGVAATPHAEGEGDSDGQADSGAASVENPMSDSAAVVDLEPAGEGEGGEGEVRGGVGVR